MYFLPNLTPDHT